MTRILIIFLCCFLTACQTSPSDIPNFSYTDIQEKQYLSAFRSSNQDMLFFVMVNRDGKVVKVELVDWDRDRFDERSAHRFKLAMYEAVEAEPVDETGEKYRQYVYPIDVNKTFSYY